MQFLKGGLLIIFSVILVASVLIRGLSTEPDQGGAVPFHNYERVALSTLAPAEILETQEVKGVTFVKLSGPAASWWQVAAAGPDPIRRTPRRPQVIESNPRRRRQYRPTSSRQTVVC